MSQETGLSETSQVRWCSSAKLLFYGYNADLISQLNIMTLRKLEIPMSWVKDGIEDCRDGFDEEASNWEVCGSGWTKRFVAPNTSCSEVFLCSHSDEQYTEYNDLCDGAGSCDTEHDVCKVSRNIPELWNTVPKLNGVLRIGYFLPGLEDLTRKIETPGLRYYESPDKPFGVPLIETMMANQTDCRFVYGELYVYLSCNEGCSNAACILPPVKYDSCHNVEKRRVFTLANNNYLTIARRSKGSYVSDLFACGNGYCVVYDKVGLVQSFAPSQSYYHIY